jgi:hypothetical protein
MVSHNQPLSTWEFEEPLLSSKASGAPLEVMIVKAPSELGALHAYLHAVLMNQLNS